MGGMFHVSRSDEQGMMDAKVPVAEDGNA